MIHWIYFWKKKTKFKSMNTELFATETHEKIALKLGVNVIKGLGAGTKGTAYELSNGLVMKITRDESEYYQASELKGKDIKHLCNIFETYYVKSKEYEHLNIFVILQEKIDTSRNKELEIFEADTDFHNYCIAFVGDRKTEQVLDDTLFSVIERFPHYESLALQYKNLALTQKKEGFTSSDIFHGNLGRKNGVLTAFDFGYSNKWKLACEEKLIEI